MTLTELRAKGREQACGNILILFLIGLIWEAVISVLITPAIIFYTIGIVFSMNWATGEFDNIGLFVATVVVFMIVVYVVAILINGLVLYGNVVNNNRMFKGEKATFGAAFEGLKRKKISLKTFTLMFLYIILWGMIPFVGIILMIIKEYAYSCAFYIMQEDNNINGNAAITKSRQLMNGYKMKMFLLDLSYIGWYILVLLTCGILGIWVGPWHNQARYNLYQQIKTAQVKA